jgi:hypothetical protein
VTAKKKRPRRGTAFLFEGELVAPGPRRIGARGDVPSDLHPGGGPAVDSSPFGWFSSLLHLLGGSRYLSTRPRFGCGEGRGGRSLPPPRLFYGQEGFCALSVKLSNAVLTSLYDQSLLVANCVCAGNGGNPAFRHGTPPRPVCRQRAPEDADHARWFDDLDGDGQRATDRAAPCAAAQGVRGTPRLRAHRRGAPSALALYGNARVDLQSMTRRKEKR